MEGTVRKSAAAVLETSFFFHAEKEMKQNWILIPCLRRLVATTAVEQSRTGTISFLSVYVKQCTVAFFLFVILFVIAHNKSLF